MDSWSSPRLTAILTTHQSLARESVSKNMSSLSLISEARMVRPCSQPLWYIDSKVYELQEELPQNTTL